MVVLPTYVGIYEPTMYVVPGLLARLGNSDVTGLKLARIGTVLVALVLVVLAAFMLVDRRAPGGSLVGLMVALTPTAVYLNSVLNPNGGEIIASLCFGAAMVRVWRDGGSPRTWVWLIAGASGATLALSRPYGPLWVFASVAASVILLGPRRSVLAVWRGGWPPVLAVALVLAGVIADLLWWRAVGVPRSRESLLGFPRYLWLYTDALQQIFQQEIGVFGWMDISLSGPGYVVWDAMVVTVLALALLVASLGERIVLLLLLAGDVTVSILIASLLRTTLDFPGAGAVGRYFLPWSVVLILFAGEVLHRNRGRFGALRPRRLPMYIAVGSAFCQGLAVWMAARRFAVGVTGPLFFLRDPVWSPRFGWLPWLVLAAVGCAMIAAAGLLATIASALREQPATEPLRRSRLLDIHRDRV